MMLTDKNIIIDMALTHCDEEGSWLMCTADQNCVGEDVD